MFNLVREGHILSSDEKPSLVIGRSRILRTESLEVAWLPVDGDIASKGKQSGGSLTIIFPLISKLRMLVAFWRRMSPQ
jgi:hypothetical protein